MSEIHVVSVNPAGETLGSLNKETAINILRVKEMVPSAPRTDGFKRFVDFIFGNKTTLAKKWQWRLLLTRGICGAIMIGYGIGILAADIVSGSLLISAGALAILGLFDRVTALSVAGYFIYLATESISAGQIDWILALPLLASLPGVFFGAGRISSDFLIRKSLLRFHRKHKERRERKLSEKKLSYQAFRFSAYR